MPKLHGIKPHPAFDLSVSPHFSSKVAAAPAAYQTTTTKAQQPHYSRDYLESLSAVEPTIDAPHDVAGMGIAMLVGSWASLLIAYLSPHWLLDKSSYNLTAFFSFQRETIFLRRIILAATVLASHGLSSAFAAHLRGLFFGTDQTEMVQSKLGEWRSHRAHQQTYLQAFPASIFTRSVVIFVQGLTLFVCFWLYLVYPPLVLSVDRWFNAQGTKMITDALHALKKGDMPRIDVATAPAQAQWFWGLTPDTPFSEVLKCMRADDVFHSVLNEVCLDSADASKPSTMLAQYMDTHIKGQ